MIRIFDKKADDFSTNGLGTVDAIKCTVSEILNGMYELELTCDLDEQRRYSYLALDNIVVAPVPAGTTPMVSMPEMVESPSVTYIYRVTGGSVNFRKGPGGMPPLIGPVEALVQMIKTKGHVVLL